MGPLVVACPSHRLSCAWARQVVSVCTVLFPDEYKTPDGSAVFSLKHSRSPWMPACSPTASIIVGEITRGFASALLGSQVFGGARECPPAPACPACPPAAAAESCPASQVAEAHRQLLEADRSEISRLATEVGKRAGCALAPAWSSWALVAIVWGLLTTLLALILCGFGCGFLAGRAYGASRPESGTGSGTVRVGVLRGGGVVA